MVTSSMSPDESAAFKDAVPFYANRPRLAYIDDEGKSVPVKRDCDPLTHIVEVIFLSSTFAVNVRM